MQGLPHWSLPVDVLQCPKTASSGRRLMVVNCGGSYGFLPPAPFGSWFIQPPAVVARSVPAISAASRRSTEVVEDRQNLLRSCPTLHIDFFVCDSHC